MYVEAKTNYDTWNFKKIKHVMKFSKVAVPGINKMHFSIFNLPFVQAC